MDTHFYSAVMTCGVREGVHQDRMRVRQRSADSERRTVVDRRQRRPAASDEVQPAHDPGRQVAVLRQQGRRHVRISRRQHLLHSDLRSTLEVHCRIARTVGQFRRENLRRTCNLLGGRAGGLLSLALEEEEDFA